MKGRYTWLAYAALPAAVLLFTVIGLVIRDGGMYRMAEPFTLAIVAGDGARDRDRVSMTELRGRVVLLDFWASWCAPCRESIPIINEVIAEYEGQPLEVIGINVEPRLSAERLREAHRSFGARFPSVRDPSGNLERAYAVDSLPTLVVIDASQKVREVIVGVPDRGRLEALLSTLIAESESGD